jgi:hypothetical protein
MVEISDIIGLLGDGPAPSPASPAAIFRKEVLDFIGDLSEEAEPGKPAFLRASGLYQLCARREALGIVFPELVHHVDGKISAGLRMTMDLGSAVHEWWQDNYLGPMGKLWGHWFCLKCDSLIHTGLMPKKCEGCGTGRTKWIAFEHEDRVVRAKIKNIIYVERSLVDNELGLSAHPDGLIYSSDVRDIQQLFELKTITSDGLDKVERAGTPKPEHIIQVHAYMHLTGVRETFVAYLDKGKQCLWEWTVDGLASVPGSERLHVYHVEFDDELWDDIVREIKLFWQARELERGTRVSADVAPFRRRCEGPSDGMARECPMRTKCFALRVAK